jgi:hypothetical protein
MSKRAKKLLHQAVLPADDEVASKREALRVFDPCDTMIFLEDARARTGSGIVTDDAVEQAMHELETDQVQELARAMDLDPQSPDFWKNACIRLAQIHHNVGRLVHRWTPRKGTHKSSLTKKRIILRHVDATMSINAGRKDVITQENHKRIRWENAATKKNKMSERKAIRLLAKSQKLDYRDQMRGRKRNTDKAREEALRRAYYRAKKSLATGPLGVTSTKEASMEAARLSNFERLLQSIEKSRGDN